SGFVAASLTFLLAGVVVWFAVNFVFWLFKRTYTFVLVRVIGTFIFCIKKSYDMVDIYTNNYVYSINEDIISLLTDFSPISVIVISRSASKFCNTDLTPCSPATAKPYIHGLPTRTACAPSDSALIISDPLRIPLSMNTGI